MTHRSADTMSSSDIPRGVKVSRSLWMIASSVTALGMLWMVVYPPKFGAGAHATRPGQVEEPPAVRVVGPGEIMIAPTTPLREQLVIIRTKATRVTFPQLSVTGSVMARVRDGKGPIEDRWQFATPDLSTTYADWLRTKSDVEFTDSQLRKTRELVAAETAHLESVVQRLKPLNQDALVATSHFKQAEAELLKAQIQGEKSVFEAQSNSRTARKHLAALERDLAHAGIDPEVFDRAVENMALVVANVPESRIREVQVNQACEARFYSFPDTLFPGHVESLGSSVTPDRRTLRVLFELTDAKDLLRPGMFGEVGLGTDARDTIVIPSEAVLHIARRDYVITAVDNGLTWRVSEVKLGELRNATFEVLAGLDADHDLITEGAILLKPLAVEALAKADATPRP